MSKKSSLRKSLSRLFSKSEMNLKDYDRREDGSGRSLRHLFRSKRGKKKKDERVKEEMEKESKGRTHLDEDETIRPPSVEKKLSEKTGSKQTLVYGAGSRSKKRSRSYSESDLRKGTLFKRFSTFMNSGTRKKKGSQIDMSSSSTNLQPDERSSTGHLISRPSARSPNSSASKSTDCLQSDLCDSLNPLSTSRDQALNKQGKLLLTTSFDSLPRNRAAQAVPCSENEGSSLHNQSMVEIQKAEDEKSGTSEKLPEWAETILSSYLGPNVPSGEEANLAQHLESKESAKDLSSSLYCTQKLDEQELRPVNSVTSSRSGSLNRNAKTTQYNITIHMTKKEKNRDAKGGKKVPEWENSKTAKPQRSIKDINDLSVKKEVKTVPHRNIQGKNEERALDRYGNTRTLSKELQSPSELAHSTKGCGTSTGHTATAGPRKSITDKSAVEVSEMASGVDGLVPSETEFNTDDENHQMYLLRIQHWANHPEFDASKSESDRESHFQEASEDEDLSLYTDALLNARTVYPTIDATEKGRNRSHYMTEFCGGVFVNGQNAIDANDIKSQQDINKGTSGCTQSGIEFGSQHSIKMPNCESAHKSKVGMEDINLGPAISDIGQSETWMTAVSNGEATCTNESLEEINHRGTDKLDNIDPKSGSADTDLGNHAASRMDEQKEDKGERNLTTLSEHMDLTQQEDLLCTQVFVNPKVGPCIQNPEGLAEPNGSNDNPGKGTGTAKKYFSSEMVLDVVEYQTVASEQHVHNKTESEHEDSSKMIKNKEYLIAKESEKMSQTFGKETMECSSTIDLTVELEHSTAKSPKAKSESAMMAAVVSQSQDKPYHDRDDQSATHNENVQQLNPDEHNLSMGKTTIVTQEEGELDLEASVILSEEHSANEEFKNRSQCISSHVQMDSTKIKEISTLTHLDHEKHRKETEGDTGTVASESGTLVDTDSLAQADHANGRVGRHLEGQYSSSTNHHVTVQQLNIAVGSLENNGEDREDRGTRHSVVKGHEAVVPGLNLDSQSSLVKVSSDSQPQQGMFLLGECKDEDDFQKELSGRAIPPVLVQSTPANTDPVGYPGEICDTNQPTCPIGANALKTGSEVHRDGSGRSDSRNELWTTKQETGPEDESSNAIAALRHDRFITGDQVSEPCGFEAGSAGDVGRTQMGRTTGAATSESQPTLATSGDNRGQECQMKLKSPVPLVSQGEESQTSLPEGGCGANGREEPAKRAKGVAAKLTPPTQIRGDEAADPSPRRDSHVPGSPAEAGGRPTGECQVDEQKHLAGSLPVNGAAGQLIHDRFLYEDPTISEEAAEMSYKTSSGGRSGLVSSTLHLKIQSQWNQRDEDQAKSRTVFLVSDKKNITDGYLPPETRAVNGESLSPVQKSSRRFVLADKPMEDGDGRRLFTYEPQQYNSGRGSISTANHIQVPGNTMEFLNENKSGSFPAHQVPAHQADDRVSNHMFMLKDNSNAKGQQTSAVQTKPTVQIWEEPPASLTSTLNSSCQDDSDKDSIFKAELVQFIPIDKEEEEDEEADTSLDIDSFVDTLRSINPSVTLRRKTGTRAPRPVSLPASLPPIDENLPSPDVPRPPLPISSSKSIECIARNPVKQKLTPEPQLKERLNLSLPPSLNMRQGGSKQFLTPSEMMRNLVEDKPRVPTLNRASADNSIVFSKTSILSGLGAASNLLSGKLETRLTPTDDKQFSRLENSFLFSNYKSQEARERPTENGKRSSLADSLYRFSSMPDLSSSIEKSLGYGDVGKMSAYERLSFLSSPTSSLPGTYERLKVSLPPSAPQFNRQTSMDALREVASASPTVTPRNNHTVKYRAFPDAYQTKEKEHGKINPRPGKIYIYDQPGFTGNRTEIYSDVIDATSWVFPETISIRVVRGGWVLYEKPDFKGEKFALEEGDIELSYPFGETEEHSPEPDDPPRKKFVIGSLRRAVRDYSVPELCLFPEDNAEGKKVIFRDTSEDARIYGLPIRANSIIVNAGLWLVYAKPFFEGIPRVIEVGGYSSLKAWGAKQPDVCSVHPLKIGEPKVENINEPKVIIYEKPYFTGKCREVYTDTRDFMTRTDSQNVFMPNAGSIKVLGGCWVGYQKEGFRGHQYLLEEGDFHDWRVWGGCDSELKSLHLIRADFSDPEMVMHECNNEDVEVQRFHVVEATPDLELLGYKSMIQSIHVLSGAWIAYSHVDYSGNQYILEKGYYHTWQDWGASDFKISSVQPILMANGDSPSFKNKIYLFSEPSFQGNCLVYDLDRACIPESFKPCSFRVVGGSWVVYEGREFSGNLYVLGEGEYPNFTTIGCAPNVIIRSVKMIPIVFSEPSISIYSLECFEGKEIVLNSEIQSLLAEGFNNHVLSVRVKGGIWVACEHSNYRGSQILLEESIEITNWLKFSEMSKIGSLYPIRQKRIFFHLKNRHRGQYMTIQGDLRELKSCRVVVSEQIDGMSHVWYYQEGLLKNKLALDLSLQVVGNPEEGSKLVLWTESRIPRQSWKIQPGGRICSLIFEGMTMDVKGGKTYDKDHIVMWSSSDERPTQIWDMEII
ncbi:uncharacterized protein crybg2 [Polypterus senegalus]|uniref:uncharacterized protein crybg2 n=1 Tax=Polypterus senegalus TaxID=55291 RepID=UPI0019623403|nr:uncharacterized protein crybg2 [Polypterus senegalus]